MSINILSAINDRDLYRPFLGDLSTWSPWAAFYRTLHGLPIPAHHHALVEECTGRPVASMPPTGFQQALLLCGRRSGKSRTSALLSSYEACLAGHESKLAPGEQGMVIVAAPTLKQGRIVRNYIRAAHATPLLEAEITAEDRHGFTLRNGIRIEVLAGEHRSIRGFTAVAVVVDEVAMFGSDPEARIKSDVELIRALEPALLTTNGRLIAVGTPYRAAGWTYETWKRDWGNPNGSVLVWRAASRTMNPTLSAAAIDAALARDPAAARTEYFAEFRDDLAAYITREMVECLVVAGRVQLLPRAGVEYFAFADLSGGRADSSALAIGHREERMVVLDYLGEWRAPHSPQAAIGEMVAVLRKYRCRRVTTDAYAAEFAADSFRNRGMMHEHADLNKSQLYLELLPRLCSGEIELVDNSRLVDQLASLERRAGRSSGKDTVDHPPNGHDDLANAVAGCATVVAHRRVRIGAMGNALGWKSKGGPLCLR